MSAFLERARELDGEDELAGFRQEFVIADPNLIYLDGNSLGRLPKETAARLEQAVNEEWGGRLIRAWNEGWFEAAERIGDKIGELLGARAGEVIIADSTSINLYKLAFAALRARPGRHTIVTDEFNFPSDVYVLQGLALQLGEDYRVRKVRSPDGISMPKESLAEAMDADTALVCLSHPSFKSGFLYELTEITQAAHDNGALMLWDLSHGAGAVPIELNRAGVDLAVGCTYKYLNAGPGAPAFLFVRRDLQEELVNPVSGWFGQKDQFEMELEYRPATGVRRFLSGTPPTLSLLGIEPGVDLILEAGMDRLRRKSVQQTEFLIELWQKLLEPLGFSLNSPRQPERRGSHISLGHENGLAIDQALINEMDVLPDFRRPDNIRLGVAPIYTTFDELYQAAVRMQAVVVDGIYKKYLDARPVVT